MLEKIVDAAIRLGIPLSLDKQAVLSLLIEGKSTRAIAGELDIETIEAKQYANDAIEELERFMDSFSTIETERTVLELTSNYFFVFITPNSTLYFPT